MKPFIYIGCFLTIFAFRVYAQEEQRRDSSSQASADFSETIFQIQVRVIFASPTGIHGNVVYELMDMRKLLISTFQYPSYELSNSIRLSLFGEEEATALVFPEHYIRILPKGVAKGNRLKVKAEVYHIPENNLDARTRVRIGETPHRIEYQERERGERGVTHLPIVGSAFILTPNEWEAFGGIPVRVDSIGSVRSNTLSSSPLRSSVIDQGLGTQRYLILGLQQIPDKED